MYIMYMYIIRLFIYYNATVLTLGCGQSQCLSTAGPYTHVPSGTLQLWTHLDVYLVNLADLLHRSLTQN